MPATTTSPKLGIGPHAKRGTAACIPSTRNRKVAIPHDSTCYRQRHKVEIMFGRLKD